MSRNVVKGACLEKVEEGVWARTRSSLLDQQKVPLVLLHHGPPVDVLLILLLRPAPYFPKQAFHPAKRAKLGVFTQAFASFSKDSAEGGVWCGDTAGDQERPDERTLEAVGSAWDELERLGHLANQVHRRGRVLVEARYQRAEVDASGKTEGGRHVSSKLLGSKSTCARERMVDVGPVLAAAVPFQRTNLFCQRVDMAAEENIIDTTLELESLEAGNLRDDVHDAVVAAHELAEPRGRCAEMLLAVGVCKERRATEHGGTENVDPGCQSHVERWLEVSGADLGQCSWELKLVH